MCMYINWIRHIFGDPTGSSLRHNQCNSNSFLIGLGQKTGFLLFSQIKIQTFSRLISIVSAGILKILCLIISINKSMSE